MNLGKFPAVRVVCVYHDVLKSNSADNLDPCGYCQGDKDGSQAGPAPQNGKSERCPVDIGICRIRNVVFDVLRHWAELMQIAVGPEGFNMGLQGEYISRPGFVRSSASTIASLVM